MALDERELELSGRAYRACTEHYFNAEYAKNLGLAELAEEHMRKLYATSEHCIVPNPENSLIWLLKPNRQAAIEAVIQESHKNPTRWKAPKDLICKAQSM